jgi:hypothetical protein
MVTEGTLPLPRLQLSRDYLLKIVPRMHCKVSGARISQQVQGLI